METYSHIHTQIEALNVVINNLIEKNKTVWEKFITLRCRSNSEDKELSKDLIKVFLILKIKEYDYL